MIDAGEIEQHTPKTNSITSTVVNTQSRSIEGRLEPRARAQTLSSPLGPCPEEQTINPSTPLPSSSLSLRSSLSLFTVSHVSQPVLSFHSPPAFTPSGPQARALAG